MRVWGGVFAGLAVATIVAAPAFSQDRPEAAQPSAQAAFTPDDDLDCAIYIGALMAETEVEMTPESRIALTSAFTYFVGRYEAQRGTRLNVALAERYPAYAERNPQEIEQVCSVRARGFAMRLQDSGRVMAEMSASASEPSQ